MKIFEKRISQHLDPEHELCNIGETAICTRTSWILCGIRIWFSDEVIYFEDSQFSHLKRRIRNFEKLPVGWDSYNAPRISSAAIENCLDFVENLVQTGVYPDWVEPACDGGIILEVTIDGEIQEWDFLYDGEVSAAVDKNDKFEELEHEKNER